MENHFRSTASDGTGTLIDPGPSDVRSVRGIADRINERIENGGKEPTPIEPLHGKPVTDTAGRG